MAKDIKELINDYEFFKKESDKAEELYTNNPENLYYEVRYDELYKAFYDSYMNLVSAIVEISGEKISREIAKKMINTKFDQVKKLFQEV